MTTATISASPGTTRTPTAPLYGPVMVDVAGLALTASERDRLCHPRVGGVILFARNFNNREQLRALTSEIHELREAPLLIAVDHEGGRVQRFREGYVHLPAMGALGKLWDQDPAAALAAATDAGLILAGELRRDGVDFSFTPVLDLDWGESSVIGDRAFHRDPTAVLALARALNHGLLLAGMSNCGKHFPGHGWTRADSHHELPIDERTLETILAADASVFARLGSPALSSVMTAHVVYPAVDPLPASFSTRWLREILRGQLAFDGLIFSDDLSMAGAEVLGGIEERARAALRAGCDMVLVCNAPDLAHRVLLADGIEGNPQASERIAALRPRGEGPSALVLALARARLSQHFADLQGAPS